MTLTSEVIQEETLYSLTTWKQLEQFIGDLDMKYKIPKGDVLPFLLEGVAADVQWHVMDWDTSDKNITYKKTMENGLQGHSKNEAITAVGFYSEESYRVLTHNGIKMQIHFVNYDHTLAAYMDDISLDTRLKLYLPEQLEEK